MPHERGNILPWQHMRFYLRAVPAAAPPQLCPWSFRLTNSARLRRYGRLLAQCLYRLAPCRGLLAVPAANFCELFVPRVVARHRSVVILPPLIQPAVETHKQLMLCLLS